jgi:hypothetical protein
VIDNPYDDEDEHQYSEYPIELEELSLGLKNPTNPSSTDQTEDH